MHKIDGPGATPENEFTEGNPTAGTPATVVGAKWLNSVQRELIAILAEAGITPSDTDDDQVLEAIQVIVQGAGLLDTPSTNVASAATVNLTTAAPDTRHINITGSVQINQFTVAAGLTYFVRFDAALTLTNNANIVTQRGTNITVAAGDTCIIRATAENVVEVLCGSFLIDRSVGSGKSYVNQTGSRSLGAVYTNTSGRDRLISVSTLQVGSALTDITVGGVFAARAQASTSGEVATATAIVPSGQTYSVSAGNTLYHWGEL